MIIRLFGWKHAARMLDKALERECAQNADLQKLLDESTKLIIDHERRIVMLEDKLCELMHQHENDNK